MARHEPDPRDAGRRDRPQDLGEARLAVEVAAVAVHVLAQERDLEHPVRDEPLDLGDDRRSRARLRSVPRTYGTTQYVQ